MAFSGIGAKQNPGRWNSAEVPMVYAAESLSLAMLEMLVHLDENMLRLSLLSCYGKSLQPNRNNYTLIHITG